MKSKSSFRVKVVREPGNDPITGFFYDLEEQEFEIEALNKLEAYNKSLQTDTISFRGQLRRTFIDGEEYFDPRH